MLGMPLHIRPLACRCHTGAPNSAARQVAIALGTAGARYGRARDAEELRGSGRASARRRSAPFQAQVQYSFVAAAHGSLRHEPLCAHRRCRPGAPRFDCSLSVPPRPPRELLWARELRLPRKPSATPRARASLRSARPSPRTRCRGARASRRGPPRRARRREIRRRAGRGRDSSRSRRARAPRRC